MGKLAKAIDELKETPTNVIIERLEIAGYQNTTNRKEWVPVWDDKGILICMELRDKKEKKNV